MAQIPTQGVGMLSQRVPGRIVPRAVPRLKSYAQRITAKTDDYVVSASETIPGADLEVKFVSNSYSSQGDLHEYYILMVNGDPEAVLDIWSGPSTDNIPIGEVGRLCASALHIFVDGVEILTFPQVPGDSPNPTTGYGWFTFP